ncbi:MAG TPA: hypothetical protein VGR93_03485 [Candidatus Acidoferrales bacterium]|nr:hypothetical protein [Candidatus Acidoferrales bacterium]
MMRISRFAYWALACVSVLAFTLSAAAQVNPELYSGLKWRNDGPFHGGRISSVTGAIGQPGVFYFGAPQGGIWKTTSAGVTWFPIFDQVKSVDSVGAIQVAPSNPDIVYAGAGDPIGGSLGNGMWKSTDAGKTWQHIGLEDTVKIDRILVDPTNPNLVIVSALGDDTHNGGGIYRSTDGGQTWTNVLKRPDGYDGTREVEYAYDDPSVMLADTQGTGGFRFGPPSKTKPKPPLMFKSTDEGQTWTQIKIPAFPGRVAVAIAMHTNGQRIYIVGNPIEKGSGLFRSDDGGATWKHMAGDDTRIGNGQGSYSSGVFVDSQNPDIVYTVSTAMYRSIDGGVTFHAFKGAPGGEDYHKVWIDPTNGKRILVGTDQGASVSLDGGQTWSLWYTEPISQVYHVATDSQYPYWIMASQQDTGAVMISSRGTWGQVNFTDWSPLPSSEFGIITPDPQSPHILYGVGYGPGGGGGSDLIKIDMSTGQWQNVAPNFGADATKYRSSRDFQKEFDTAFDPSALYVAYQCLLVSRDGAHSWKPFSPDLTTPKGKPEVACGTPLPPPQPAPQPPPKQGPTPKATPKQQPTPPSFPPPEPSINDFSISTVKRGVVWTVSSNSQICNTMDGGKHWNNVSNITDEPPHAHLNTIAAGDDVNTAYITGRIAGGRGETVPASEDADVPLIWRTTDGGKTWTSIVNGLPRDERTGSWVNILRADPEQPGLLFAGTETTVYVSFDNGDHWQSLRQNLPSTSIRDLVIHTDDHMNDLVIGTYGRGFWILDDMTPLREIAAHAQAISSSSAYLFKPEEAIRARINSNWDQPTSIEVPHAPNPSYGAIVDYYLSQKPNGPIQLQVFDSHGDLVRTISSTLPPPIEGQAYPRYWLASPQSRALTTDVGLNRVNWDLHYDDPPALRQDLENQMNMVAGSVTPGPHGPQVIPGVYTLKLTVDGKVYTREVTVMNDPRVGQGPKLMAALRAQNQLTMLAYHGMQQSYEGRNEVETVKEQLASLMKGSLPSDVASQAKTLDHSLDKVGGEMPTGPFAFFRRAAPKPGELQSFLTLNDDYNTMVSMMQVGLDMAPTPTQIGTWESDCSNYNRTVDAWKSMQQQIGDFNAVLAKNNLQQLKVGPTKLTGESCSFKPSAK